MSGQSPTGMASKQAVPGALIKYGVIAALCSLAIMLAIPPHTALNLALETGIAILILLVAIGWPLLTPVSTADMSTLIAFIGCDGSGKSTLSQDMLKTVSRNQPAATCYLGLGSGELGNRIKRLPVIGKAIERRLAQKAKQTRSKNSKIPGPTTALV